VPTPPAAGVTVVEVDDLAVDTDAVAWHIDAHLGLELELEEYRRTFYVLANVISGTRAFLSPTG
jgi:hypothetical protein